MRSYEATLKAHKNSETLTDGELLVLVDDLIKTSDTALKKSLLLPHLFNEEDLDRQRKSLELLLDLKNSLRKNRNETKN